MRALHSVADVRAAEETLMARLPEGALMARAAAGLARRCALLLGRVYGARVGLLVGTGNNGGDALYAGALLARRGARVDAVLVGDAHPGGLAALRAAGGQMADTQRLARAELVIDGLVGIGARGGLREPAAALAAAAERAGAVIVAVDVPSGVDADTGAVAGPALRADVTVTFGVRKPGLAISPGAEYVGELECVDLGLDLPPAAMTMLDADDVAALLPKPGWESSKYARGVLGLVAGSDAYTGAAVLAAGGALRCGVGMLRYAGVAHPAELVRSRWPEAVVTVVPASEAGAVASVDEVLAAGRVQAWAVGPGMGTGRESHQVVQGLLATDLPVLLDADALTVVADYPDWLRARRAPTLLTPHAGEFARLVDGDRDDVEAHRLERVVAAAADLGVTVLLKGSTTVVADPNGAVRVNPTGTRWLATAGSGDVLTGACGALLATGLSALDAGAVGAWLHGLAGQLAGGHDDLPVVAEDLVVRLPEALRAARPGR